MRIRPAAVAGTFYPAHERELRAMIDACVAASVDPPADAAPPSALVVPHAGLVYSGPVAASAYRRLEVERDHIRRVVLLGPSHRVPLRGLALSSADTWATPLGPVPVDPTAAETLAGLDMVAVDDRAHAHEHCLEVQLPFLQTVLDSFELVPIVVGDTRPGEVEVLLDRLWEPPETIVIVSTDLSHYHRHADAVELDSATAAEILALHPDRISDVDACGARPLRGLLRASRERQLTVDGIDLRNSGDTAGDRERVVGYGAVALH